MTYRLIGDSCTDLDDNLKKDENRTIKKAIKKENRKKKKMKKY